MTTPVVDNVENAQHAKHEVDVGLARFDRLPDWLAGGMDGERVAESLRRHLPVLASARLQLLDCEPQRLRSKEDAWLARYLLTVVEEGVPRQVVLVGRLCAPGQAATLRATTDADQVDGWGWRCFLPDLGLDLEPEDRDPGLPSLQRLTDPVQAASLLGPVLRESGYAAGIESCWPEVVRYKPGSRCTAVVHITCGSAPDGATGQEPPDVVVLKTHQGDKGQTAWNAMTALWDRKETWRGAVTLAQPLAFLADERILVQGPVPEDRTLKELCREAIADGSTTAVLELQTRLEDTARALAGVHASPVDYGRTASFEEELDEVREVVSRLSTTVPGLEGGAAPFVQLLARLSVAYPADPAVPAHHDFRPAQVLLHGGSLGFIDFDGASMAEPALDLGRFRAKLRDIGVSTLIDAEGRFDAGGLVDNVRLLDDLCDQFLDAYLAHAPVTRQRVVLWETCDLFTAVLHAWTKVRLMRLEPRLAVLRARLESDDLR